MSEWIGGRNPVFEVLRTSRRRVLRLVVAEGAQEKGRLAEILRYCRERRLPVERAGRARLDKLAPANQGVALEVSEYPYADLLDILELAAERGEPPFILVLDALQDPQNLGSLLRTAEVVGVHGVVLPYRRTATVSPAVVNVSAGASEHLLIAQVNLAQALAALKKEDIWVVGLEGSAEGQLPQDVRLDGPLALVVGSEGEGMRSLVRSSCDLILKLPMRGQIESLNAAVAGSIALYLAWQAHGFADLRA